MSPLGGEKTVSEGVSPFTVGEFYLSGDHKSGINLLFSLPCHLSMSIGVALCLTENADKHLLNSGFPANTGIFIWSLFL